MACPNYKCTRCYFIILFFVSEMSRFRMSVSFPLLGGHVKKPEKCFISLIRWSCLVVCVCSRAGLELMFGRILKKLDRENTFTETKTNIRPLQRPLVVLRILRVICKLKNIRISQRINYLHSYHFLFPICIYEQCYRLQDIS